MSKYEGILESLDEMVETQFKEHPFSHGISKDNFETVMGNFLTASLAAPYLFGGAQLRLFFHYFDNEMDIPHGVQVTAAVGAFMTWDELGGNDIVRKHGNEGLPKILDAHEFHSSILREDMHKLIGKDISPRFSETTKRYLKDLSYGLSNVDPVTRISQMVAFEKHGEPMLKSLWTSVANLFSIDKDKLPYFVMHVGGSDPAEQYHVALTKRMISEVIKPGDLGRFIDEFQRAYSTNFQWCEAIKHL